MKYIGWIIVILLIAVGVTFAVLNSNVVTVNYYFGEITWPLSLLLAISLAVGVILGVLVMSAKTLSLRFENRRLKKRLKVADQEVENLRTMPVKDEH